MARIRTIKPEFFTSDDICALPALARLLYIGLWCEADREGRLVWTPGVLERRYLPDDSCDIEALCGELVARGLVRLYGDGLACIPSFARHQHVNVREAQSKLPPPPGEVPVEFPQGREREEGKERKGRERSARMRRRCLKAGSPTKTISPGLPKPAPISTAPRSRPRASASATMRWPTAGPRIAGDRRGGCGSARRTSPQGGLAASATPPKRQGII